MIDPMNEVALPPPRVVKTPRARYLLALDLSMLTLVCVLEALSLTGLAWHEWLGFLLCLLVLTHLVLQWPWFFTEFRRISTRGAYRARVNSVLNYLLFTVMVAVLVSGVLISNQIAPLTGNALGRPRVWSELHGWLNFTLVVLVGVHLALNWDWILGVLRRRTVPLVRLPAPAKILRRGAVVLFVVCLVAAAAYAMMSAMLKPEPHHVRARVHTTSANQALQPPEQPPQSPEQRKGRHQSFHEGMLELDRAALIVIFVVIVGRYVLRIHL